MARAQYRLIPADQGWLIDFEGRNYGPYQSNVDAFKTAVHAADGERQKNPDGSEIVVEGYGPPRLVWNSEYDAFPMDYAGRMNSI